MINIEAKKNIRPITPANEDEGFEFYYTSSRKEKVSLRMDINGASFVKADYDAVKFEELAEEYLEARRIIAETSDDS